MNKKRKIRKGFVKIAKSLARIFLLVLIVVIIFSSGAYLATTNKTISRLAEGQALYLGKVTGKYDKVDGKWAQNVDFSLYFEVWEAIKNEYVNKGDFSEKKMFYGSLEGMVASLGDPYTEFMDPQKNKEFNEDMSGTFEGIGAEIGIRDEILTIISPIDGTPAQRAGLMPGDKILEIDGEPTQNMNINEAVSRIRGTKGTEVILDIFREGTEDIQEVKIIRDTIIIRSVTYKALEDDIFLIKISSFNGDTENLFSLAIKEILALQPKGVIIDLRSNPGGYLETSVSLLGEWIDGEVAVIEGFGDDHQMNYRANGLNRLKDYPTVILINAGSASASEILTGALQYYDKAIVVGEKSYGKGSVQIIRDLKDGSALKITMAEWLTPGGKNINKEGIIPDVEVELTYEDYLNNRDPQLEEAKRVLKDFKK
ncbi:MAG: S41 family peptidase [Patescibacteria group bacterium]|nr:S41 family peptidase [Patescibacteria group bacterium]